MGNKAAALDAALEITARAFTREPFDSIRVADIAREARCSMSTLYEVYGSKQGLIVAAMAHAVAQGPPSETVPLHQIGSPLHRLMATMEAHGRFMTLRTTRMAFMNTINSPPAVMGARDLLHGKVERMLAGLAGVVEEAIEQGQLRPLPPAMVAELLLSCSAWRTMLFGLVFGIDQPVAKPPAEMIRLMFLPLMTPAGEAVLDEFIATRCTDAWATVPDTAAATAPSRDTTAPGTRRVA